ncbi:hypothetical protein DKP76_11515 [Falsochrobactrum shanghaiense]|uniref:Uncharacterized protein n=1 Tax=Falsochrobactrum shanghaiense TaxID=2201899 RepID=A0A316J9F7_9HYPH|nr:hypothetical protein [Falsochrobactrum shanghaiense]PWL17399.1 hypothetical protein DKP76_11515 [Falsochrobactrum shanghaiense]
MSDPKVQPKAQTIEVEIVRDFWDADGNRCEAGTCIEVPVEAALEGIETGALRRAPKAGK